MKIFCPWVRQNFLKIPISKKTLGTPQVGMLLTLVQSPLVWHFSQYWPLLTSRDFLNPDGVSDHESDSLLSQMYQLLRNISAHVFENVKKIHHCLVGILKCRLFRSRTAKLFPHNVRSPELRPGLESEVCFKNVVISTAISFLSRIRPSVQSNPLSFWVRCDATSLCDGFFFRFSFQLPDYIETPMTARLILNILSRSHQIFWPRAFSRKTLHLSYFQASTAHRIDKWRAFD